MKSITYQHAYDECGRRVHISEVEPASHRGRIFKCISCGGDIIAKIGNQERDHAKAPHFAHKQNCACNSETYLHKLGKMLFKERFESGKPIKIICPTYKVCQDYKNCLLYDANVCREEKFGVFNLREWYDKCTEEKEYGGLIADLLLESTTYPQREPIFIEIAYSHKCSEQKIASKHRIIEVYVSNEIQLAEVISGDFKTDNTAHLYNFELKETGLSPNGHRDLELFTLSLSGNACVKTFACRESAKIGSKDVAVEYIIYKPWTSLGSDITTYDIGFLLAYDAGCDVRNCATCKYHREERICGFGLFKHYYNIQLFCRLSYTYNTPTHPQQNDARVCQFYSIDHDRIAKTRAIMNKIRYWKLPLQ